MSRRSTELILRSAAAGALAAGLFVASPSAMACACGGMVGPEGSSIAIGRETAVLHLDGGLETIYLQLAADSDLAEAGLLLPTPAPAQVALGDEQMFADLFAASEPRIQERQHFFGPAAFLGWGGSDAGAPNSSADPGVQVLNQVDLGPLEATVLAADDPNSLGAWLDEHDYAMSEEFASVVTPYTEGGWAFVAVQLTAEGQALAGDLPPLQVTFDSDELVYPMRMSQAAKTYQQTRTYVLDRHRTERTDTSATLGRSETLFAGQLDPTSVASPALRELLGTAPYLTTIDQNFADPSKITSDFTFAAAASDEPFQRVIYEDTYLIPVDVAILLGLVLLGSVVGLVALLVRRRVRLSVVSATLNGSGRDPAA